MILSKNIKRAATVCAAALMVLSAGAASAGSFANANASRRYHRHARRYRMMPRRRHLRRRGIRSNRSVRAERARLARQAGIKNPRSMSLKQLRLIASLDAPKMARNKKSNVKNVKVVKGHKAAMHKNAKKLANSMQANGKAITIQYYVTGITNRARKAALRYLSAHQNDSVEQVLFHVLLTKNGRRNGLRRFRTHKAAQRKAFYGNLNHRIDNSIIFTRLGKSFRNTKGHHMQIIKYMMKNHVGLNTAIRKVAANDVSHNILSNTPANKKARAKRAKAKAAKIRQMSFKTIQDDITQLATDGSFNNMSNSQARDTIAYLIQHPKVLSQAVEVNKDAAPKQSVNMPKKTVTQPAKQGGAPAANTNAPASQEDSTDQPPVYFAGSGTPGNAPKANAPVNQEGAAETGVPGEPVPTSDSAASKAYGDAINSSIAEANKNADQPDQLKSIMDSDAPALSARLMNTMYFDTQLVNNKNNGLSADAVKQVQENINTISQMLNDMGLLSNGHVTTPAE